MRTILRRSSVLMATVLAACSSGGGDSAGSGGDQTPPLAGTVADGLGADVDLQVSTTTINANWSGFSDTQGPIALYEWSIGTTPGAADVQEWSGAGTQTTATNGNLSLQIGSVYYVSVRAYDAANNASAVSTSDGVEVEAATGGGPSPTMAASVSQWGITWTFDREYPVGQFCNGDWWVLGPVNVTDISPHTADVSGRTINGSMVNPAPTGRHGYDSTLYGQYSYGDWSYFPALNVALGVSSSSPLVLQPSSSLISVISQMTPDPGGHMSQLSTAAVLTALATEPPAGSFRPPYTGTDKTVRFQESQIDWGALGRLDPLSDTPDPTTIEPLFARVWLDHCPDWMSRFMHPLLNMKDYGRDFTADTGSAALLVNMDFTLPQKRKLVIGLCQLGIDNWANVLGGATWPGLGGQGSGRKFPILFAGRMLNDAAMLNVGVSHPSYYRGPNTTNSIFSEDCQTFYVEETSPGIYNWGNGNYNASHVGIPEWGNNHTTMIYRDNSSWTYDPYRVCCTFNAYQGFVLAVRVMGLRAAWNHQALFDYMDRYMQTETTGNYTNYWIRWHGTAWYAYRSQF